MSVTQLFHASSLKLSTNIGMDTRKARESLCEHTNTCTCINPLTFRVVVWQYLLPGAEAEVHSALSVWLGPLASDLPFVDVTRNTRTQHLYTKYSRFIQFNWFISTKISFKTCNYCRTIFKTKLRVMMY